MITIENFDAVSFDVYDINLVQREVDGGIISIEQIDSIKKYPSAKSIVISGLKQETFDYFVNSYGSQFEAITFWKNKSVADLSSLSNLCDVKFISYFFNQKASELWDMTSNTNLIGLSLTDFRKIHSLNGIEKAGNLTNFYLYDRVDAKMVIESFKPIINTGIRYFCWGANRF